MNKVVYGFLIISIFVLLGGSTSNAQVAISQPVDIVKGVELGEITVSIKPDTLNATKMKIFDGEAFSSAGWSGIDSIQLTIQFDDPISVTKSKVHFVIAPGTYSLEIAQSLNDLDSKTGTYQKIEDDRSFVIFQWDSVMMEPEPIKVMRLTARNRSTNSLYFGEWVLESSITIDRIAILPQPPMLLPDTKLKLNAKLLGTDGKVYPTSLIDEVLIWRSSNKDVSDFLDENTTLTGKTLGTSEITVKTLSGNLEGSAIAEVLDDFSVEKADPLVIKVAVVYQNPMLESSNQRLHQRFGWINPKPMVAQLVEEYNTASKGVLQFEIVEEYDGQEIFTMLDSSYMSPNSLEYYYNRFNQFKEMAEQEGRVKFDYYGMLEYFNYYEKSMNGEVDEVWVYGHPFTGMYESQLVGKDAFWWNSPPKKKVPEFFTKLISVMGFNYERTVDLAMHSFGHRMESAMAEAYGRWDVAGYDSPDKPFLEHECAEQTSKNAYRIVENDPRLVVPDFGSESSSPNGVHEVQFEANEWEIFTTIDMVRSGEGQIGNIHFPFNGTSDYDYSNRSVTTKTYAENWRRYPYLFNRHTTNNCAEFGCNQLGYMRWWFGHIPHFAGITNGVLNNWWHYFVDPQGAFALAKVTPVVGIESDEQELLPKGFKLHQNYPNPFNPVTTISYVIDRDAFVELKIYNVLGQLVEEIVSSELRAGMYTVRWSPTELASGTYFCRISVIANDNSEVSSNTIKMMYLK